MSAYILFAMPQKETTAPIKPLKTIRSKLLISFLLIGFIPSLILTSTLYRAAGNKIKEKLLEQEKIIVEIEGEKISAFLSDLKEEILFLSQLSSLENLINSEEMTEEQRKQVQDDFFAFSQQRGIYYQLRYLDETGQEIVRVDNRGGNARVISGDNLQSKAGRYYFEDAMLANQGTVFVSPLDLNIENGAIEVPHVPVIRYATPLFNNAGVKKGIVISNINASIFLNDISHTQTDNIALVNSDGYFLFNSEDNNEWGFMYNNDETIFKEHEKYADVLMSRSSGQMEHADKEHYMTFKKIYPSGTDVVTSEGSSEAYSGITSKMQGTDYFWVLFTEQDFPNLTESAFSFNSSVIPVALVISIVVTTIAFALSNSIAEPIKDIQKSAEMMSRGEFGSEIKVPGNSELSKLAHAFNKMARSIKIYQTELEERVKERTSKVENINDTLIGREAKMMELKQKIKELKKQVEEK